jgi:YfiH family protein
MVTDQVQLVRVPRWQQYAWLRHGFSTRDGGVSRVYSQNGPSDLNLGFTKDDDPAAVLENRRRIVEAIAGSGWPLVAVKQVHGTYVHLFRHSDPPAASEDGRALIEADGLMTAASNVLLGVQAADCTPVIVADTRLRVVAAFHAGWRGTLAAMVEQGIARMRSEFGSVPEDLIGAVGPAIGPCCYAVGDEVREGFTRTFPYAAELFAQRDGAMYLDLHEANRRQLAAAGLSAEAIAVLGECTGCSRFPDGRRKYFSHRMERGFTGRAMGLIGIADPA